MIPIDVVDCPSFYHISLTAQHSSFTDMVTFLCYILTNLAKHRTSLKYILKINHTQHIMQVTDACLTSNNYFWVKHPHCVINFRVWLIFQIIFKTDYTTGICHFKITETVLKVLI
jgi:hypothetical protein